MQLEIKIIFERFSNVVTYKKEYQQHTRIHYEFYRIEHMGLFTLNNRIWHTILIEVEIEFDIKRILLDT